MYHEAEAMCHEAKTEAVNFGFEARPREPNITGIYTF